ncbi:MAG: hypothetical protein PWQ35_628 [Patescibacteria group bacterium]|nr:hypothetical protein [Patescibacteria group bacterium]
MSKPRLSIVLGTARKNRQSQKVAHYLVNFFRQFNELDTTLVDVRDYATNYTIAAWEEDEAAKPWRNLVAATAAFIFVVPEYNRSFPGELKLVLDSELAAYDDKPVILAGVSIGSFGGLAALTSLLPVLHKIGLRILPEQLYFPEVEELFKNSEEELALIYESKLIQVKDAIFKSLNL